MSFSKWPNELEGADIAFAQHPMHHFNGDVLFDAILESSMSTTTKHEIIEWLWAIKKLDDDQYKLAMSRVKHLEKKQKQKSKS